MDHNPAQRYTYLDLSAFKGVDMHSILTTLIDRLDQKHLTRAGVLKRSAPVPSFGDSSVAAVATVGINPSNREFVDEEGEELEGSSRRFHTLSSLGLEAWSEVDARHLSLISESCRAYFYGNPYDIWFRRLDYVLSGTGFSFYGSESSACHLDLIPYATSEKWSALSSNQRSFLLAIAADTLGLLIRDSPITTVVLNGSAVVQHFEKLTAVRLTKTNMPSWLLGRQNSTGVEGFAYKGTVDRVGGVNLTRRVLILGYNHNIQSSFGVTSQVLASIRDWIAVEVRSAL